MATKSLYVHFNKYLDHFYFDNFVYYKINYLKLKISEIAGLNEFYFSEKLFKCLRMVCFLLYIDIPLPPLYARGQATSFPLKS